MNFIVKNPCWNECDALEVKFYLNNHRVYPEEFAVSLSETIHYENYHDDEDDDFNDCTMWCDGEKYKCDRYCKNRNDVESKYRIDDIDYNYIQDKMCDALSYMPCHECE
jgi:hypothetical protein